MSAYSFRSVISSDDEEEEDQNTERTVSSDQTTNNQNLDSSDDEEMKSLFPSIYKPSEKRKRSPSPPKTNNLRQIPDSKNKDASRAGSRGASSGLPTTGIKNVADEELKKANKSANTHWKSCQINTKTKSRGIKTSKTGSKTSSKTSSNSVPAAPNFQLGPHQVEWSESAAVETTRLKLYAEVLKPENFCLRSFAVDVVEPLNDCSAKFVPLPRIIDPVWRFLTKKEIQRVLYMSPEQCLAASGRLDRLSPDQYSTTMNKINDGHFLSQERHKNTLAELPYVVVSWNDDNSFSAGLQEGAHRIIAARIKHKCNLMPIMVTFTLTVQQARHFQKGIMAKFQQADFLKKFDPLSFCLSDGEAYAVKKLWDGRYFESTQIENQTRTF